MFCEECGTKNKENATFCESCGHKMPQEVVTNTTKTTSTQVKKPMDKKTKTIIGVVAAVAVVLIGGYMYLSSLCTPEKIALKYFKAYTSNDADALYSTLNLEKSEFVSKDILKEKIKDNEEIKIANYQIKKGDIKKDVLSTTVTVTYVTDGSSRERTKSIKLTKNKKNKWLFFDNWTVDSSELVATKYSIYVPAESTLKIDGETVSDKYKDDESSTSEKDAYEIPTILASTYKLTVELKSGMKLEADAKINNGSYGYLNSSSFKLESKTKTKIEKEIKEKLELLYKSAIEKKSFDDIKDSFNEGARDDIEYLYNNMKDGMESSYKTMKSIDINSISVTSVYISDDELQLTASMKYKYTMDYKKGDETKNYSSNELTDRIFVDYKLEEKDYYLSDMSSINYYFSAY